jgi:predicted small lipoprotein YifL
MMKRMVLAMLIAASVAACGYRGGLERPAPILWEDRTDYEAQQKAKAEAEQKKKADATAPAPAPK